jgi:nitrate/nitrite transporter NarK
MGRVMGIVLTADSVAESLVPMLVARLRDSTGSYQAGFMVLVALAAVGALAVSLLPSRRDEPMAATPNPAGVARQVIG